MLTEHDQELADVVVEAVVGRMGGITGRESTPTRTAAPEVTVEPRARLSRGDRGMLGGAVGLISAAITVLGIYIGGVVDDATDPITKSVAAIVERQAEQDKRLLEHGSRMQVLAESTAEIAGRVEINSQELDRRAKEAALLSASYEDDRERHHLQSERADRVLEGLERLLQSRPMQRIEDALDEVADRCRR